ncbi:MAG: hypothetical protein JOZ62_07665 [Acidobacteriaceae bacterium]|nr:hypothetical protein [Acidobacteriaceae bacterium]
MIRKHVDLIAIGILLCGIAVYSQARHVVVFEINSAKRIAFTQSRCPTVVIPRVPRIPYTRD